MKQASSRELFGYWAARRGARRAPERGEIEPSAIRRALGDVFILQFDARSGHPFRLAGTRVCALFGRELKNEPFLNLWGDETRPEIAQLLSVVADEVTGAVAGVTSRTDEGWKQDLELILLPLTQRGDTHARMIGALTPFNAPFWLGVSWLGTLTLGNVRHLDPAREMPTAARLVAGTQGPGRRAVFTVHEGGRA
jgi:hypothetical protein